MRRESCIVNSGDRSAPDRGAVAAAAAITARVPGGKPRGIGPWKGSVDAPESTAKPPPRDGGFAVV